MPKKKKSTSFNLDALRRDGRKLGEQITKENPSVFGKELPAGSAKRESPLEQDMGPSKYREMIHRHNDENKHILDRLPFTFPKKKVVRSHLDVSIECVECGYISVGSEYTIGFSCPECKQYRRVRNPEALSHGGASSEEQENVGIFGTASDLVAMRERRRKASDKK